MRHFTGINRVLYMVLLVASLILPSGINKQAMANTNVKANGLPVAGYEMSGNCEEDYSIPFIKIFNWI